MDLGAVEERLKVIVESLERINQHLIRLNSKTATHSEWIAAADPVLDSLNERLDNVIDKAEGHEKYINRQEGGALARALIWSQIATAIGMIVALVKLFASR